MKMRFSYLLSFFCLIAAWSCKKDNFKAPSSTLSGRLVYNGAPIGVEFNQVPFELYQSGFGKVGAISGTFSPDGSYSALLFDGNYRFTIPSGQGPFLWKKTASGAPDTLVLTVAGNQTQDIEVTPYYTIISPQITVSNGSVMAKFGLSKIIADANAKNVERVNLYINKTMFVSGADNIAKAELAGSAIVNLADITLNVSIPTISPVQNYVFASIGVKIDGVEDMLFSPVQKLTF